MSCGSGYERQLATGGEPERRCCGRGRVLAV